MSTDLRPPSANEAIKAKSRFLRGTIAEGLTRAETGSLSEDDQQLTKFHGIYLQDERDLRAERGRKKMEKAFIFMARLRVPGGVLTPAQWLAAETVARERGNGTLRLTTRQTIQFHGIIKTNLREAIRGIHDAMLDTIAACGDVNRNVIARVNPWQSQSHGEVAGLAQAIGARGRNWLVFGHRNYTHDFLYQLEWQDLLKRGVLTRLDVAFSRDQPEKRYVQHALWDARRELYAWVQDGAAIYVCGDANAMAKDVHATLQQVLGADALDALRREGRYLRDVY